MVVMIILGPEAHGSHFEQAKVAYQKGAGATDFRELVDGQVDRDGKPVVNHVESVERKT
jgi:hypothetical protein